MNKDVDPSMGRLDRKLVWAFSLLQYLCLGTDTWLSVVITWDSPQISDAKCFVTTFVLFRHFVCPHSSIICHFYRLYNTSKINK